MTEWLKSLWRDLWRSSRSTPLVKQGYQELFAQEHLQTAFEYLWGWRLCSLSRQPVPLFVHFHRKMCFPNVLRESPLFHFVPVASYSVTEHHWEEPDSIFCTVSLQVFTYIDKTFLSYLISILNGPWYLNLFSYRRCFSPSPLIISVSMHWAV